MVDEPEIIKKLKEEEKLGKFESQLQNSYVEIERSSETTDGDFMFSDDPNEDVFDGEPTGYDNSSADELAIVNELLFQASSDLMLFLDKAGKIIKINKAGIVFSGFSEDEIIGKRFWKLPGVFSKKNVSSYLKVFKNILQGKETKNFESGLTDKSGKTHIMDFSTYPIKKNRKVTSILVVAKDVTEIKGVEEKLETNVKELEILDEIISSGNNPDDLQSLLGSILDHTLTCMDFDGGGVYLVDEAKRVAEIQCARGAFLDFIKTVWRAKINEEPYSTLFVKGQPIFTDNFAEIMPEAAKKWGISSVASIPLLSKGKVIGAFNVASEKKHSFSEGEKRIFQSVGRKAGDIIAKVQAEEKIKETEGEYRNIFNSATDSFLIFDLDGNIVDANPQACKMYGYSHEELIKLSGRNIVHPDYYHLFEQFKQDVKKTGKFCAESIDVHKDGTQFNIEVRGTAFDFNGEPHLLAVIRDVTERKQVEEELKKKIDELETFHDFAVGREFKMLELKKEINELCEKLGEKPRYDVEE